jgi:hypothetical protein
MERDKYDMSKCSQFCSCGAKWCGDLCGGQLREIEIKDEETGEVEMVVICQIHHMGLIEFVEAMERAEAEVDGIPKHELN